MMIRPAELAAIKAGTIDLAFRRWARPRVVVGTQMRTAVGLVEVTSVDQVTVASLRAEDGQRSRTRPSSPPSTPSSTGSTRQRRTARGPAPRWT